MRPVNGNVHSVVVAKAVHRKLVWEGRVRRVLASIAFTFYFFVGVVIVLARKVRRTR